MKKQTIILLLFLSFQTFAQKNKFFFRKTVTPCSSEMTDTIKGKWINEGYNIKGLEWPKTQFEEGRIRVNKITEIIKSSCPSLIDGGLVSYGTGYLKSSFANQVKYEMNKNNILNEEVVTYNSVPRLQYALILFHYFCHDSNEIWNWYPDVEGSDAGLVIHANTLPILNGQVLQEEGMTIDGRPIKYKMPTMGTWKGYEMMTPEGGANAQLFNSRYVLISRPGMLPYIPVTRKQYLELAIKYLIKLYDGWIASTASEKQVDEKEREKGITDLVKTKKETVKYYQDELEKSAKLGLLDSTAIIFAGPGLVDHSKYPIFLSEAEGGRMLVTENPDYFRKDLPKYVPQLFVLEWSWHNSPWSLKCRKLIEENLQAGNLLEMIDK